MLPSVAIDVDEERYLDLDELSTYSGLSRRTLERFQNHPTHPLPFRRVSTGRGHGGRVLVGKRAFDLWLKTFPGND